MILTFTKTITINVDIDDLLNTYDCDITSNSIEDIGAMACDYVSDINSENPVLKYSEIEQIKKAVQERLAEKERGELNEN